VKSTPVSVVLIADADGFQIVSLGQTSDADVVRFAIHVIQLESEIFFDLRAQTSHHGAGFGR
jgi:hypothetical protein